MWDFSLFANVDNVDIDYEFNLLNIVKMNGTSSSWVQLERPLDRAFQPLDKNQTADFSADGGQL